MSCYSANVQLKGVQKWNSSVIPLHIKTITLTLTLIRNPNPNLNPKPNPHPYPNPYPTTLWNAGCFEVMLRFSQQQLNFCWHSRPHSE